MQNYLLATEDLNRTIEESLQLTVSRGKLNDKTVVRHISKRDDPLYNFFRKNDNPLDSVYRKEAKFDVQNPIIGSLLKQINKGKTTEKEITKILDKGPDPRVFDLEERYNKLIGKEKSKKKGVIDKFFGNNDDDDDDDDSSPGSPSAPSAPPSPSTDPPPPPPSLEDDDDDDDDDDPLIRNPKENYFPYSFRMPPEEINLDGNLREVFSDANEAFETEAIPQENNYFKEPSEKLDRGEIPEELEFFSGGVNNVDSLFRQVESNNLVEANQEFL